MFEEEFYRVGASIKTVTAACVQKNQIMMSERKKIEERSKDRRSWKCDERKRFDRKCKKW